VTANVKIIVEKHPDGYVAYPIGLKGVVIGQGATYEEALDDVRSAIAFHIETFGSSEFVSGSRPAARKSGPSGPFHR
jgi:predicted RNase H-like HicB family nuclease